jgi:hypothetical protein
VGSTPWRRRCTVSQQVEQRRQQFDIAQLVAERETVAGQLAEMAAVRSPYGGTVRRVRVLGQADRLMAVEVVVETAAVKDGDGAEWLVAPVGRQGGPIVRPLDLTSNVNN